jgi:hypothetical protein
MTTCYKDQFRYSCRNSFFHCILDQGLVHDRHHSLGLAFVAGKSEYPFRNRENSFGYFGMATSFIKQVSSGNLQQFQQPFLIENRYLIPLPCLFSSGFVASQHNRFFDATQDLPPSTSMRCVTSSRVKVSSVPVNTKSCLISDCA